MAAIVVSGGGPVRRRGGFGGPASISFGAGPCASWGGGAGLWGLPWLVLRGPGPPDREQHPRQGGREALRQRGRRRRGGGKVAVVVAAGRADQVRAKQHVQGLLQCRG